MRHKEKLSQREIVGKFGEAPPSTHEKFLRRKLRGWYIVSTKFRWKIYLFSTQNHSTPWIYKKNHEIIIQPFRLTSPTNLATPNPLSIEAGMTTFVKWHNWRRKSGEQHFRAPAKSRRRSRVVEVEEERNE